MKHSNSGGESKEIERERLPAWEDRRAFLLLAMPMLQGDRTHSCIQNAKN